MILFSWKAFCAIYQSCKPITDPACDIRAFQTNEAGIYLTFINVSVLHLLVTTGQELPKQLSGSALVGAGLAGSVLVGQMVAHMPFILQTLMGHEVSECDLTRLSNGKTLIAILLSGLFGGLAGGEVDIANAVTNSLPASDLEHVSPEVITYVPIAVAVLTFAALATYAPKLIQDFLAHLNSTRGAADVQNNPPPDPEMQDLSRASNAPDDATQEDRQPSDGLVVLPTITLSSPQRSGNVAPAGSTALDQV